MEDWRINKMVSIIMNTVSMMILFLFADKIYPHYYPQKKEIQI